MSKHDSSMNHISQTFHTINTIKSLPQQLTYSLGSSAHFNSFDDSKNSYTIVVDQDAKNIQNLENQLTYIAMLLVRIYKFKAAKAQALKRELVILNINTQSNKSKQQKLEYNSNYINQLKQNIRSAQVLHRQFQQEKQIASQYQRFLMDAIAEKEFKTSHKRSSKNLPQIQKVTQLDMQNAIEELRSIKKMQTHAFERQAILQAKLQKQIHQLRTMIKQKEDLLKQVNCEIFVTHIHKNIRKNRHENKKSLSKKQITRNSLNSTKIEQTLKYSLFIGNQKLKSEAVCIKDTKILKQFRYNLYMIKFFVSQDQIGFQCYYGNQNNLQQGRIHSWTGQGLITQSLTTPIIVKMYQLYSFGVYYDRIIRGFQLNFRNNSYKIIGERRQKYNKEQFLMNHKIIKYFSSYWQNSQLIGVTIGYKKIIQENRNSLQYKLHNVKTDDESTPYRQYYV